MDKKSNSIRVGTSNNVETIYLVETRLSKNFVPRLERVVATTNRLLPLRGNCALDPNLLRSAFEIGVSRRLIPRVMVSALFEIGQDAVE